MKKLISSLLALCMLFSFLPVSADAASPLKITISEYDGSALVMGCDPSAAGDIVIPSEYNGRPVTFINKRAFEGCSGITGVTIPESVTDIGVYAFSNCTGLTTVRFLADMRRVPEGCFSQCTALRNLEFGVSVTMIQARAFAHCESLTELALPNNIESIGQEAFLSCTNLCSAVMPGVTAIYTEAFKYCPNLHSITIPETFSMIKTYAFAFTTITDVYYGGTAEQWAQVKTDYSNLPPFPDATIHYQTEMPVIGPVTVYFKDVPISEYYAEPVKWATNQGITRGYNETTFGPDDPCTRGQIVTFLYRSSREGIDYSLPNPFSDVSEDAYYNMAVRWAVKNRITEGTGNGKFSPDEPCTRAQVVTFLWRYLSGKTVTGSTGFADVPAGEYYTVPVLWAVQNHVTTGTDAQHFSPDEACTRAQIVTFLYRAIH